MKKTKLLNKILVTTALTATLTITNVGMTKAGLQANPNTQYTKTYSYGSWIQLFREMETSSGTMGLSETLNSDLTASSESNNIDVHMMRATEYGAIAILSASGYGNPSNDKAITSTTGNNTGMMLNTSSWEWVAGTYNSYSGVNSKYYDRYTSSNSSAKIGDALGTATTTNPGCAGWRSASDSSWVNGYYPYFVRGGGGIFSFSSGSSSYCARGVAVCGEGV